MNDLFEVEHDGKTYAMDAWTLLDELTYSNYKYNRRRSPDVSSDGWKQIFPQVECLERRYQKEHVRDTDSPQ